MNKLSSDSLQKTIIWGLAAVSPHPNAPEHLHHNFFHLGSPYLPTVHLAAWPYLPGAGGKTEA